MEPSQGCSIMGEDPLRPTSQRMVGRRTTRAIRLGGKWLVPPVATGEGWATSRPFAPLPRRCHPLGGLPGNQLMFYMFWPRTFFWLLHRI
jgi:hypothetical protein